MPDFSSLPNLYKTLNILPTATPHQIRSAYRALALDCHPDKTGNCSDNERMMKKEQWERVSAAHDLLGDERQRRDYDDWLKRGGRSGGSGSESRTGGSRAGSVHSSTSKSGRSGAGGGSASYTRSRGPERSSSQREASRAGSTYSSGRGERFDSRAGGGDRGPQRSSSTREAPRAESTFSYRSDCREEREQYDSCGRSSNVGSRFGSAYDAGSSYSSSRRGGGEEERGSRSTYSNAAPSSAYFSSRSRHRSPSPSILSRGSRLPTGSLFNSSSARAPGQPRIPDGWNFRTYMTANGTTGFRVDRQGSGSWDLERGSWRDHEAESHRWFHREFDRLTGDLVNDVNGMLWALVELMERYDDMIDGGSFGGGEQRELRAPGYSSAYAGSGTSRIGYSSASTARPSQAPSLRSPAFLRGATGESRGGGSRGDYAATVLPSDSISNVGSRPFSSSAYFPSSYFSASFSSRARPDIYEPSVPENIRYAQNQRDADAESRRGGGRGTGDFEELANLLGGLEGLGRRYR